MMVINKWLEVSCKISFHSLASHRVTLLYQGWPVWCCDASRKSSSVSSPLPRINNLSSDSYGNPNSVYHFETVDENMLQVLWRANASFCQILVVQDWKAASVARHGGSPDHGSGSQLLIVQNKDLSPLQALEECTPGSSSIGLSLSTGVSNNWSICSSSPKRSYIRSSHYYPCGRLICFVTWQLWVASCKMSNNSYTDDAIYEFVKLSLPQQKFDFENGARNRNSLQECEHT
jgi:hypothetical protein